MKLFSQIKRKIALVTLLCMSPVAANAIQIYGIDSTGGANLLSTSWITYGLGGLGGSGTVATDVSAGAGTDWEVLVGFDDFGDSEFDTQATAIYGAGTTVSGYTAYQVVFDVQAYTFDSYDALSTVAPGAVGYWDAFAVNMNSGAGYYWDIVANDPIVATDPAGNVVIEDFGTSATGGLSGSTWAWGGLDYGNNTFESEIGVYSLNLTGVNDTENLFVSAVLDTMTFAQADEAYPSWGCFNAGTGTDCPVPVVNAPEPTALALMALGLIGIGFTRRKKKM